MLGCTYLQQYGCLLADRFANKTASVEDQLSGERANGKGIGYRGIGCRDREMGREVGQDNQRLWHTLQRLSD